MADEKQAKKPFERLPTDVLPRNYKLELKPDLKLFTFEGKLEITTEVVSPTKVVVLDCAEITITSVTYAQGNQDATITYQEADERVTFEFPSELPKGEATLSIKYSGILNDQMRGFYRSKYTHPDSPSEERYAAVTQFEAADARRALPCWDEPAHKATFDVTLIVPKHLVALSNMNEIRCQEVENGLKCVTFDRTPVMSTYLLAFIVGEFDFVEERDANGVLIRVYTPVGKAEQGRFALDVAVKTLPFYKDYFNVEYPLPKMDLIAIQDFAAGAMENWGLVTYRERLLLVDPLSSSVLTKQLVAVVVGHELAHQWFGNLATMEWWTHLWLNEGFATWIEYLCVDHTHPEYEIWTNFLSREYTTAMSKDAFANSHPIEVPVGPPSEVEEIFDAISYCKGACVIRMLHDWIGEQAFRKGLHDYLTSFAYKNASTDDLWAALASASNKPVAEVMSTWTTQIGYPVLTVEGKQEGANRVLTVSQKKFCADGNIAGYESMQWKVPVAIATSKDTNVVKFLLDEPSTTVTLEGVGPDDWILVNPGRKSYYRVSYSGDLFTPLLPALTDGTISPQDRLGLQNDAFALARAGVGNTVDVLRLFSSYTNETNYTVWESLAASLSTINRLLQHTDFYPSFQAYCRKLVGPSGARLGWDPRDTDSALDTMLRSLIFYLLAASGDPDTVAEGMRRFKDHVENNTPISSDMKGVVYHIAMANGDDSHFDQLWQLHDAADSSEDKVRIYRCLGAGKTEQLTQRCLELALSDKIRPQDSWSFFMSAARTSSRSRDQVWKFMKEKWSTCKERFKGTFLLSRLIEISISGFVSEETAQDIEQFFEQNPVPVAERTIKQCCEGIRLNAQWLHRDLPAIQEWLKQQ